jgi:glucose dehydrogenase
MAKLTSRLALGVAFAAALGAITNAQLVPGAGDWTASNFNETANRYSLLDQITAANVATLAPAWRFHMKPAGYTGPLKPTKPSPS